MVVHPPCIPSFGNSASATVLGPRHYAPPLSVAGTNQSKPPSPDHSDWLREGLEFPQGGVFF